MIVTAGAVRGLARCRQFLDERHPVAAARAAQVIAAAFSRLETTPSIGRPHERDRDMREIVIGFGDSGYIALYRHEPDEDAVYVLAFRHQREAGY